MSRTLAEALGDLADEVEVDDASRTLAPAVWRRGRRRRLRARVAQGAMAAAVVVAALLMALPGAPLRSAPPAGDDHAPLGYPQRIGKPWRVGELPERGEPLAGVAFGAFDTPSSSSGTWYAVAQDGGLSHLSVNRDFFDVTVPALSADGRLVGYVDRDSGHYVIRNVVTGRLTRFPSVAGQQLSAADQGGTGSPYLADVQTPGYFSPDGQHVAVRALAGAARTTALLVLGVDGSVREVPWGEGYNVAGWLDDTQVLALSSRDSGSGGQPAVELTPVAVDLSGQTRRLPTLQNEVPFSVFLYSQWSPSLSPDRRTLLIVLGVSDQHPSAQGQSGIAPLVFDLQSGRQTGNGWSAAEPGSEPLYSGTPVEWRGNVWVLPRLEPEGLRLGPEGDADPDHALIVTDPRLRFTRLDLADRALSGPVHESVWGTSTSAISWRTRELVLLAGAGALAFAWWARRRAVRGGPQGSGRSGDA
jgi:hypothetical protein